MGFGLPLYVYYNDLNSIAGIHKPVKCHGVAQTFDDPELLISVVWQLLGFV